MVNTPASKHDKSERPGELRWIPVLAGAFAVLVALVATLALTSGGNTPSASRAEMFEGLGGDFTLTAHTGAPVSLTEFRGKVVVLYFGYTYCPDVCPIHLTLISAALDRLGRRADQIQPLFVSVDPARDNPATLASYVSHFFPSLIGLTGTEDEVAEVAGQYAVARQIVHEPGLSDYTVSHTSVIYVLNREGRVVDLLSPDATADQIAAQLREHL